MTTIKLAPRRVAGLRRPTTQATTPVDGPTVDRDPFNGLTRLIVREPDSSRYVINWLNVDQARQLAADLIATAGGDR